MDTLKTTKAKSLFIILLGLLLSACSRPNHSEPDKVITDLSTALTEFELCQCFVKETGHFTIVQLLDCTTHRFIYNPTVSFDRESILEHFMLLERNDSLILIKINEGTGDYTLKQAININDCLFKMGYMKEYAYNILYMSEDQVDYSLYEDFKDSLKKELRNELDLKLNYSRHWLIKDAENRVRTSLIKIVKTSLYWESHFLRANHDPDILKAISERYMSFLSKSDFVSRYNVSEVIIPVSFFDKEQLTELHQYY